jgi:4-carboxymuconolactone decarboxylase
MTTATPDEALAVKLTRELTRTHAITDETFAAALARFGDSGVVELVATASYYSMLAFVHNSLLVGR